MSNDLELGVNKPVQTWKLAAQTELFSGWQRWLSFTCIWVWSCITAQYGFGELLMKQLPGVLSAPNELAVVSLTVVIFIILVFSNRIPSIVESLFFIRLASGLLIGGSALFALGMVTSHASLYAFGILAGGASVAILKVGWGEMYSRMTLQRGLLSMGYALVAATLIMIISRDLPAAGSALVLVAVSVPCAYLLYRGAEKLKDSPEPDKDTARPVKFTFSLLLLPFLVSFSYGIVKGMMPSIEVENPDAINVSLRFAELLVGIALLVFSYKLGRKFGAAQIYAFAIIFVVAGLILFTFEMIFDWAPFFFFEMGFALFYFFMVVYWGNLSRRTGMHVVRTYAIGYFAFSLAQVIGSVVGYYAIADLSHSMGPLVLLSVVLAFFIVVLFLFSGSHSSLRLWLVADGYPSEQGDEMPIACAAISKEFGLSPREHEVLGLVARGRNASYVARVLYISPDTAKTHIKSIYRKVDVHTRQELIDLIDRKISEEQLLEHGLKSSIG